MKRCLLFGLFLTLFNSILINAQPGSLQLGQLVDMPAAKTLYRGEIMTELRIYSMGGLLASLLVGITDRFDIGLSYGGENIIGTGKVDMNPQAGVHVRYHIFEEQFLSPAAVIGFHSQGFGGYDSNLKRYGIKSRGFYGVVSKNTSFLGGLGLHVGVNYSLETQDHDKDINFFLGCHKWINPELVLLGEYDTAINDNSNNALGSGKGYLNVAIRWTVYQQFFIEFGLKNILENRENDVGSSREVKLIYMTSL